jgi:hypothetical protein
MTSKQALLEKRESINQKSLALEMYTKRWRDMALVGLGEEAAKSLKDIRRITFEAEKIE